MEPAGLFIADLRESGFSSGSRSIPEETAVALTYNGGTYAVMMTTPEDLEDFAVGFSLSEGVISSSSDIDSLDIVRLDDGVELRMWSVNQSRSPCRSDGRICGTKGADYAASIQSQKHASAAVIGMAAILIGADYGCHAEFAVASETHTRRERFTQRRFGISRAASLLCARTLAVITRSTSSRCARACVRCSEQWDILLTSRVWWRCAEKRSWRVCDGCRFQRRQVASMADAAGITLVQLPRGRIEVSRILADFI